MNASNQRSLFVNLPVKDLPKTMEFFSQLGFDYNRKFCDENAACMILNEKAYVMLLRESFFETFTNKKICDTKTHTEGLFALSCESREAVEIFVNKAFKAGGTKAQDPVDHGFMYAWSFYDLDGHHWEVFWMDPKAVEG